MVLIMVLSEVTSAGSGFSGKFIDSFQFRQVTVIEITTGVKCIERRSKEHQQSQ